MAKNALTKKQAEEFFDTLDTNDDGQCSIQEIKKGLQSYCKSVYGRKSDRYFADIVSDWDKDNDQLVSREEFVNDLTKQNRDDAINQAFEQMDQDKSGKITKEEFKKYMKDNGINDEDTLDELLAGCDEDGDGQISISELRTAMEAK